MTITKRGFICLAAGMLAASLLARPHHMPLPPNAPPGAYWCYKCDGDGYNWTWYGWRKTCGVCDGRGWCVKRLPPSPPPPAPVIHHGGHHHGGPAVAPKPAPKPVAKPAPKPAPGGKTPPPPKGAPRR